MRTALLRITAVAAALGLGLGLGAEVARAQMPDARRMSGIPRTDPAVSGGTMTVKVVHGELIRPVEGAPVHVVGVGVGGKVEKRTLRTGGDGRVEFTGLKTDGSVAYWAMTLVGEDRLEARVPVVPPPMVGYRLMLAGRKLDAEGKPEGPPIDDAAGAMQEGDGQERKSVEVPPGEVWVLVDGLPTEQTVIELVELDGAEPPRSAPIERVGDKGLVARFRDVPAGDARVYIVRAREAGRAYYSKPFIATSRVGVGRSVVVFDQVVVIPHIGGGLDDDRMRFDAQFEIRNFSGVPWDPGPDGLLLPIPVGAVGANVSEEMAPRVRVDPERGFIWRGPVPPGETDVVVAWRMPIEDGQLRFQLQNTTLPLRQGTIFVEYAPGATMTPPAGFQPLVRGLGGRKFWVFAPVTLATGQTLEFHIDGLPQPAWLMRLGRSTGAILVSIALAALVLWLAVADPGKRGAKDDARRAAARRRELVARREKLYEDLVKLEKRRAAGQVGDDRYERERAQAISRLTVVLREIDALDAGRQATRAA